MGIFNYIDTFFFISLGITFVLILLLVFHFKQQIVSLEYKNDTMFEIINNIVKEIKSIKNALFSQPHYQINEPDEIINLRVNPIPSKQIVENKILVSDDEDVVIDDSDENDTDSDEDSDDDSREYSNGGNNQLNDSDLEDESDDDEDDDSDDNEDSDEDNDNEKIENMENNILLESVEHIEQHTEEHIQEHSEENTKTAEIKIINIELGENIDVIEDITELEYENDEINNGMNEEDNNNTILIEETEKLIVEKLDELSNTLENIHNEQKENDQTEKIENMKEIYRKMTLPALKALVISKGLTSDSSKMKKHELIKLLESNMDEM